MNIMQGKPTQVVDLFFCHTFWSNDVCVLLATSVNPQGNFTNPLLDLEKVAKGSMLKPWP